MVRRTRPGISRFRVRSLRSRPGMTNFFRLSCGRGSLRYEFPDREEIKIENDMTITTSIGATKAKIDWTRPVLWLFTACLVVLIVLPLSWLGVFSVTDKSRHLTLQNFATLFTDPDFLDPLLTTAIIATTSAAIGCLVAPPLA